MATFMNITFMNIIIVNVVFLFGFACRGAFGVDVTCSTLYEPVASTYFGAGCTGVCCGQVTFDESQINTLSNCTDACNAVFASIADVCEVGDETFFGMTYDLQTNSYYAGNGFYGDCVYEVTPIIETCEDVWEQLYAVWGNYGPCSGQITFDQSASASLEPCTAGCKEVFEKNDEFCHEGDITQNNGQNNQTYDPNTLSYFQSMGMLGDCRDDSEITYNSCDEVWFAISLASVGSGACAGQITFDSTSTPVNTLAACSPACEDLWDRSRELCSDGDATVGSESYSEVDVGYLSSMGLLGTCFDGVEVNYSTCQQVWAQLGLASFSGAGDCAGMITFDSEVPTGSLLPCSADCKDLWSKSGELCNNGDVTFSDSTFQESQVNYLANMGMLGTCFDDVELSYSTCADVWSAVWVGASDMAGPCAGQVTFDTDTSSVVSGLSSCTSECNDLIKLLDNKCEDGDSLSFDSSGSNIGETFETEKMALLSTTGGFGGEFSLFIYCFMP